MGLVWNMKFLGQYRSPLTLIELVIAISSIVGGLYLLSPLIDASTLQNGATGIISTLGSPLGIDLYGIAFLISGGVMLYGLLGRKFKYRSIGLFLNILTRTYGLVGGWLATGLLPFTWLGNLTVLIIAIVCWLVVRGMIVRGYKE